MSDSPVRDSGEGQAQPEATLMEENSSTLMSPEETKNDLMLAPEKEELVTAPPPNGEKSSSPIPQTTSSTPKPRMGPKSKMRNGEGSSALQSPVEFQTSPLVASEPKKHRPGPKSKMLEMTPGPDSPTNTNKLDDSASGGEPCEPKKHRPGPKSKQQGGQSADEKMEMQVLPPTMKPMPMSKRAELQATNLTSPPNILNDGEPNPEQPRPRLGPKSKTRPVSSPSLPPPSAQKKPGPKSKTQTICVETDSPKRKSGPKSKTVQEPLAFENAEQTLKLSLSESLETITIKVSPPSKKINSKASMKNFIDDSNSPIGKKKRKRSFKTSNLDLPVDASFPVLLEGSTDSSKIYALPNEWKKEYSRRHSGISVGKWDAYLHPPPLYKRKKIRSLPDLFSFIKECPDCPVDPVFVNMDNTPLTVEGQIDSKLSAGACKVYDFVLRLQSGDDTDDFFPQTKKVKMSKGAGKSSSGSISAKRINGVSPEAEKELLRHASSEMPSKKAMKKLGKANNLTYKLVKKWFLSYFEFKERLTSSDYLFKEEHLPDFSDDSVDQFDADGQAAVTFTPA